MALSPDLPVVMGHGAGGVFGDITTVQAGYSSLKEKETITLFYLASGRFRALQKHIQNGDG
jgi:hypothetical protein